MKSKILFAASALMLMTACSQDETIEAFGEDNGITVRATVGANSRAAESYCPEVLPESIKMTAIHVTNEEENEYGMTVYTYGDTYFENTELIKTSRRVLNNGGGASPLLANSISSYSEGIYSFADGSYRYWPNNKLGFLAWYAPESVTVEMTEPTWDNTPSPSNPNGENPQGDPNPGVMFKGFTVAQNVAEQTDLLYDYIPAAEPGNYVSVNFKHALAQVVFSAMCENTNIKVSVKKVGICGLHGSGDYHWNGPKITFHDNLSTHNTNGVNGGNNPHQTGYGHAILTFEKYGWVVPEGREPDQTYMIDLGEGLTLTSATQALTAAPVNHIPTTNSETGELDWSNWSQVMQLIPQVGVSKTLNSDLDGIPETSLSTLWRSKYVPAASKSACIVLQCKITTTNEDGTEVVLYNDTKKSGEETVDQYLYLPFDFYWQPGYRYVYTINFGKGTVGGYPEAPDPSNPGDTVLSNIGVSISVKEYNESPMDKDVDTNNMLQQANQGSILN